MNITKAHQILQRNFENEQSQTVDALHELKNTIEKAILALDATDAAQSFNFLESEFGGFYSSLERKGLEIRLGALKERARAFVLLNAALESEGISTEFEVSKQAAERRKYEEPELERFAREMENLGHTVHDYESPAYFGPVIYTAKRNFNALQSRVMFDLDYEEINVIQIAVFPEVMA